MKRILIMAYKIYLMLRWKLTLTSAGFLAENFIGDYREKLLSHAEIFSIHRKGFCASDWCILGLNKENYKDYLSDVDYYRMHPINGKYSSWIDDKLTLKYLCAGTPLDKYMPEYYYQINAEGRILCLMDAPVIKNSCTVEDIAELLQQKGVLAIKLIAGAIGAGFYKSEFKNGAYFLNGKEMSLSEFCSAMGKLRNYIIIEYLYPHEMLAKYCPSTVNCIRYLMGRVNGQTEMLKGFIRFGTKKSGFVENYNAGGVLCYLDENGKFEKGNIISEDRRHNCVVDVHPDTSALLQGEIPLWDEVVCACEAFSIHFPQLKYLGMDFVITDDNRVKVLEINSLTSLDSIQLDTPVWKTKLAEFYRQLMKQ
ncbi:MAG: hypothetical protein IJ017_02260 [Oscillospiraceae bacterium]|nr:hypothetical protein [Oscillospiraceae bacterium]